MRRKVKRYLYKNTQERNPIIGLTGMLYQRSSKIHSESSADSRRGEFILSDLKCSITDFGRMMSPFKLFTFEHQSPSNIVFAWASRSCNSTSNVERKTLERDTLTQIEPLTWNSHLHIPNLEIFDGTQYPYHIKWIRPLLNILLGLSTFVSNCLECKDQKPEESKPHTPGWW